MLLTCCEPPHQCNEPLPCRCHELGNCVFHFTPFSPHQKQRHTRHPASLWTVHFEQTSVYIAAPSIFNPLVPPAAMLRQKVLWHVCLQVQEGLFAASVKQCCLKCMFQSLLRGLDKSLSLLSGVHQPHTAHGNKQAMR